MVELQIGIICEKYWGTNDTLSFTFCNFDQCCSTGEIQLTNGRSTGNGAVDCNTPDIFRRSKIGDCKDLEFGSGSIITGNYTISNTTQNYSGEWIKVRLSNGSLLQCSNKKYREFICSNKSKILFKLPSRANPKQNWTKNLKQFLQSCA